MEKFDLDSIKLLNTQIQELQFKKATYEDLTSFLVKKVN
jgi:hypothetical protein